MMKMEIISMFPGEIGFLKILEGIRSDFLNSLFGFITMLGEEAIIVILLATIYFAVNKTLAKKVFFTSVTSMCFNGCVKNIAKVSRPFADNEITCVKPDTATGYSFPSGHTQTFTTWSTTFAFHFKKWWLFLVASVLILLVGFSRMYLGAHFPSDVIFGIIFGLIFAIGLSVLFDKINNKLILYAVSAGIFIPFMIYFLVSANSLYADFFKTFGMILGLVFVEWFETKYVQFDTNVAVWKRIIRIVVGVLLALGIKSLVKLTYQSITILPIVLILDTLRYFLLVVISFGIWPLVFKKLKL